MSEQTSTIPDEAVANTINDPNTPRDWKQLYTLYRDPPDYRYQAIEIKEHVASGTLLIKVYGGRGDGNWLEFVIPRDERNRFADAIRTEQGETK